MKSKRKHPRISIPQDVDLYLYNSSDDSRLTGRVPALLVDLTKQGAGLRFPQVLIDGRHIFYAALASDTVFIALVLRSPADDPEKLTTLLARPVWFDRNMEDSVTPFRMGVQFVDQAPPAVLSFFVQE
ncbi:MAG: hypothetical protein ABIJ50_13400 [Pseudomonadota bacterium]